MRGQRWARLATMIVLVLASVAIGTVLVHRADQGSPADQCAKPISQRVGGWTCPGP